MSELISGKDALIALANGEEVEYYKHEWQDINRLSVRDLTSGDNMYRFRLKPRTINLNGIEVPEIEGIYILSNANNTVKLKCKTNEDALKVKEALRSIFNESS